MYESSFQPEKESERKEKYRGRLDVIQVQKYGHELHKQALRQKELEIAHPFF